MKKSEIKAKCEFTSRNNKGVVLKKSVYFIRVNDGKIFNEKGKEVNEIDI